ncbi:MAG: response regulator [Bacillota bacterium]|jgi:two-component system chemotaxis response regulator CheY
MKILIVEDDPASRKFLNKFLSAYGDCDLTLDGEEAVDAVKLAWEEKTPYDLICLDIMMPNMDGYQALRLIRQLEKEQGISGEQRVKIIMTTALNQIANVFEAFDAGCEAYAAKPIDTAKFIEVMRKLGL